MHTDMCIQDDESNQLMIPSLPPTPAKTTWTLLIYLTGPATGCVGGETIFYPELGSAKQYSGRSAAGTQPIAVGLEVGMALLHKHGQDCLLHEGAEVKEGEKWVIRSDICGRCSQRDPFATSIIKPSNHILPFNACQRLEMLIIEYPIVKR